MAPHSTDSLYSLASQDTYDDLFDGRYQQSQEHDTAPTSYHGSPLQPPCIQNTRNTRAATAAVATHITQDLSPVTSICPRSSADTFDSRADSELDLVAQSEQRHRQRQQQHGADCAYLDEEEDLSNRLIPTFHRQPDRQVVPATHRTFARLFPSMNRLEIRHDDRATDGHLNLRVETVAPPSLFPSSSATPAHYLPQRARLPAAVQLFHLRINDFSSRDFSLRRYARDSGREVCKSSRPLPDYLDPSRPSFHRSVSSALRALTSSSSSSSTHPCPVNPIPRLDSSFSYDGDDERPQTSNLSSHVSHAHSYSAAAAAAAASLSSSLSPRLLHSLHLLHHHHQNTIKLEFSNYARVDVSRHGTGPSKRYEFEWWGHRYAWRRVPDRNLTGVVSFHLVRDGRTAAPVAHIVPAPRSPIQLADDEAAGAWVPPCYMWITDPTIIEAVTDVADVIVATGLISLVDDCIKDRCRQNRPHTKLRRRSALAPDVGFVQQLLFGRRHSDQAPYTPSSVVSAH